ncbi:MAG: neutral/alkaline non-lysosomal ceramidase N-terminal domain-containing protein [Oscillospiraceae bacterium]|nr:neutral/alkaline non-lysosomal ceramidase N-terminal domain-containing protein [Oscillospiraceae bacterium]
MHTENTRKRFLVGSGKAIITPKLGTRLCGYPTNRFAASIHDDLTATAIVVSDGAVSAALVTVTVCSVPAPICQRITKLVEEKTGIKHLIFSATHTHSGPPLNSVPGWGEADSSYIEEIFLPGVVKAICDAAETMEEARMGIGQIETRTGINRRAIRENGTVSLGRNPHGPYDPRMRVISFVSAVDEKKALGTIIHFGAHGTAAGGPYPESPVTRDWSGVMTDRIEWMTDAPCVFLNGAIGDVAPRDFSRRKKSGERILNTIEQAMEVGGMAAVDAAEAYNRITSYFTPCVAVNTGDIHLTYEPLPSVEEAKTNYEKLAQAALNSPMKTYERNRWQKVIEAAGKEPETGLSYRQTLVKIGPVVFVPHPFEIFTMISLRLDEFSPVEYTLSMSNANGTNGYLPNKEEIARGGYEIWSSRYRGAYLLTEDADTELINQNLALIREMEEQ